MFVHVSVERHRRERLGQRRSRSLRSLDHADEGAVGGRIDEVGEIGQGNREEFHQFVCRGSVEFLAEHLRPVADVASK